MTAVFEVLKPGFLSTVQDLGRAGYQRYGVVGGGAMDPFALQVGNLLVGNGRGDAALEVGMGGLVLRCLEDWVVALSGADPGAKVDGRPAPAWKSLRIRKGEELALSVPSSGFWTYLALAGGIEADPVMGSRSTYLRAKLGGLGGRALARGDVLAAGFPRGAAEGRSLSPSQVPEYPSPAVARVIPGPQEDMFTEEAVRTFYGGVYEVTSESDRMGYRLKGPAIRHRSGADILSEAIAPGTVQVPPDGRPIVLLADRQTTGGYAKIATAITSDLGVVAQVRPGGKLSFRAVGLEEAQDLASEREALLEMLQAGCAPR